MNSFEDKIPYPNYSSWLHERTKIKIETLEEKKERWKRQPRAGKVVDAVLSRLLVKGKLASKGFRWTLYQIIRKLFKFIFKIFNRIEIFGLENVPKSGAIFYVNHPGVFDPLLLMAAFPKPVGCLVAWENGWFSDFYDEIVGFVAFRGWDNRQVKVEKMIRKLMVKSKYFAIWPEGHPTYQKNIKQGFSSIIRVYSVLNSKKDIIPFVPVLFRGAEIFIMPPKFRTGKVEVHFLKPVFLPREWLEKDGQNSKTLREIIDYMMKILANKQGQQKLDENRLLVWKKKRYAEMAEKKK